MVKRARLRKITIKKTKKFKCRVAQAYASSNLVPRN